MKNRIDKYTYYWQAIFLAAVILFVGACQKDKVEPPVITGVVNYAASPNDTAVTTIQTGQWVVLLGHHLSGVSQVYFGSVPAKINTALFADESLVVQLPDIPFESVPADELNTVTAIGEGGTATFNINIIGVPLVSRVRNNEASPNDTVVHVLYPGDEINIVGYSLQNATEILFQGIAADLSKVVYTDTSAIVQVPADLSGSQASLANTITYTTAVGSTNFSIKIVGPPVISYISLEVPHEGDLVHLYGYNFTSIQSFTFAGTEITDYEVSADESVLSFVSPALSQSGPVEIITQSGSFTTAYNVNDIAFINSGGVGILANMEWGDYFGWGWGNGDVSLWSSDPNTTGWPSYNTEYGVGYSMYLVYKSGPLEAGEDGYLEGWGGNQILINDAGGQWVPTENLDDSGDNWAMKFEMKVIKPWSGGTLCIRTANASNYIARYEPWKVSASKTIPVTTDGWQTVTIPLSSFRLDDGEGDPISKITDIVGSSGKTYFRIYLHNYRNSTTDNFEAAFDNFRVVRR